MSHELALRVLRTLGQRRVRSLSSCQLLFSSSLAGSLEVVHLCLQVLAG